MEMTDCTTTRSSAAKRGLTAEGLTAKANAEAHALAQAGERAKGATVYVTLEPCAHYGRTPPCAQALIDAGVSRVVISALDPFAQVDGKGAQMLRDAGIAVESGLMELEARTLNRGYYSRLERGRPFVTLKLGASLDGRTALANGESKWITSDAARQDSQRIRARVGAIITGAGTFYKGDMSVMKRTHCGNESD